MPISLDSRAAVLALAQQISPAARLPRSLQGWIEHQQLAQTLRSLHQAYFPQAYCRSRRALVPNSDANGHTALEQEFFALVDEHLFPLNGWALDAARTEHLWTIPILSYCLCWEEDFDQLMQPWQALLVFTDYGREWIEDDGDTEEWYRDINGRSIADIAPPDRIDFKQLRRQCRSSPTPIRHLPHALNWLNHSTGNLWLDLHPEYSDEFAWSAVNVQRLTRSWQKARSILDRITSLIDWLDKDFEANLDLLITEWNACQLPHPHPLTSPPR